MSSTPRLARLVPSSLIRTAVGALALGVLAVPALTGTAHAVDTRSDPEWRKVTAPNVFYPMRGSSRIEDRANFSRRHHGTTFDAACGTAVYSSIPGTALVRSDASWGGRSVIRVISNSGGLVLGYAFVDTTIQNGQIIAPGQLLGHVASSPVSHACGMYFTTYLGGKVLNPTTWLRYHVGYAPPTPRLFDAPGINIASFNFLGASHTAHGGRYATYPSRMVKAVSMIRHSQLDVIGAQEFQKPQFDYFNRLTNNAYDNYHAQVRWNDTENSLLWNKSTMELVQSSNYSIPYFGGNLRYVPAVLLRQKATGRTAWFMNVHNPADVRGPAARYRAQAIAIERAKIIELRATGRPVFFTGDFNDRQNAFCPLTADKLMMTPNSVPSMACAYPSPSSIDWLFAAGQARFSYFIRSKWPQETRISDHPIVIGRAHLQN